MPLHFLSSPVGILCLIVIAVTSLVNIYAHWIEDGLVGRLLYMATAITCAAGLFASNEYIVTSSLLILFAMKSVRNICVRSLRYVKYRKAIHAKKH